MTFKELDEHVLTLGQHDIASRLASPNLCKAQTLVCKVCGMVVKLSDAEDHACYYNKVIMDV